MMACIIRLTKSKHNGSAREQTEFPIYFHSITNCMVNIVQKIPHKNFSAWYGNVHAWHNEQKK